jgi:hypothetical protein
VTQLHVIEVNRPRNEGVVMASGSIPGAPSWQQRYVSWPQWSADGKTLFFLSMPISQPGGVLYGIELPRRGDDIDFGRLRSDLPATEATQEGQLLTVTLTGGDFGAPQSYLGRFVVRGSGELVVQVCDGDRTRLSCGLGRWDGRPQPYVSIARDRVVEPPVQGPDGLYAYVREPNGTGSLVKVAADGALLPLDFRPQSAAEPADGAWFAVRPQLAVTRHGDALLAPTAPGQLGGVRLPDGASSAWRQGSSPVWFVSGAYASPSLGSLPTTTFVVPTPDPATPTPVVTPGPVPGTTMTVILTVRRGSGIVTGATVVALVGTAECGRGTTDTNGRATLTLPAAGAPPACNTTGAVIRFQVNGALIDQVTASFNPRAVQSYNLVVQ